MDDTSVAPRQEEVGMASSDSAYGSSAVDTDTEDGHTPTTFPYNEDLTHKTILVGDNGVGKTSLLVQYDQGNFLPGSFTATVGIGFTSVIQGSEPLQENAGSKVEGVRQHLKIHFGNVCTCLRL
ncbi:ras-related protein Rab-26 [Hippoglossus stenolepis]|uniref:ras-related protein Rab-26 n=1 Tax=Hippoglossus stenolepis TaxID=195615 RepID=UPI001FAEEBE8|nr:ras-related protein Rab-26 [Hippoglossus stenolepis]